MTYQKRDIEIQFTLKSGTFDNQSGNILTVSGLKCEMSISAFGGVTGTTLELSLWGLSLEYMSKITGKAQRFIAQEQNLIKVVAAGETVFLGTITASRINLNQMPDAPIEITANAVGYERTIACAPTSVQGNTPASNLVESIANKVGLKFVNIDVDAVATNPHYSGNAIEQIQNIANDYDFYADVDIGTIYIYKSENAQDSIIPFISPENGLVGYPIFYDFGINLRSRFSSAIRVGRKIKLETSLPNGTGEYLVSHGTTHYLSCNSEGGLWETFIVATPLENLGNQ